MSYDSWTCIMVQDGPGMLADDVCSALKMAACDLALKKWDRMHIAHNLCNGVIQTAWDSHMVGTRSGVLFRAEVEGDSGKYRVNFLLGEDDLKRGAEIIRGIEEQGGVVWRTAEGLFPCPALYEFRDLSIPRRLN